MTKKCFSDVKKEKTDEKIYSERANSDIKTSWSYDQKHRNYYYDDAHGYEIYDPKNDDKNMPDD